jgi:hypothetical protein
VYELVKQGILTPAHTPLYPKELRALLGFKAITITPEGRYKAIEGQTLETPPPPPEPMPTIVVRMPASMIGALDEMRKTHGFKDRSDTARRVIEAGLKALSGAPAPGKAARRR